MSVFTSLNVFGQITDVSNSWLEENFLPNAKLSDNVNFTNAAFLDVDVIEYSNDYYYDSDYGQFWILVGDMNLVYYTRDLSSSVFIEDDNYFRGMCMCMHN